MRGFAPIEYYNDPALRPLLGESFFLDTLPTVFAVGFPLCLKLAIENPEKAVRNTNSVALFVLGKLDFDDDLTSAYP